YKVEFPDAAKKSPFDGNTVADLPAEAFGGGRAGNGRLAVLHKGLPLIFRNGEFGEDLSPVFRVDGELSKEIALALVDTSKPTGESRIFHTWNVANLVSISKGQRLDDRGTVDHHEPIRSGDIEAAAEGVLDHRQNSEEEKGHGERTQGKEETDFLAE